METRIQAIERGQAELQIIARELRDLGTRQAEAIESLVRLEERHSEQRDALGRAFSVLERHGKDIQAIQVALPPLQEARKWIVTGMVGLVSIVLVALLGLVIIKPSDSAPIQYQPQQQVMTR